MQLNPEDLVVVYTTKTLNKERLDASPPEFPMDLEDEELVAALQRDCKFSADGYDAYNDLVQVSFMRGAHSQHFMLCPGKTAERPNVRVFSDETTLIAEVACWLRENFVYIDGQPAYDHPWLTGWKVRTDVWPVLVNKIFASGYPLPRGLQNDVMSRFTSVHYIIDVSNIYSQFVSMNMRRLPALADVLRYWGYDYNYRTPDSIRKLLCENVDQAAAHVDTYLGAMMAAVLKYNNNQ